MRPGGTRGATQSAVRVRTGGLSDYEGLRGKGLGFLCTTSRVDKDYIDDGRMQRERTEVARTHRQFADIGLISQ